MGLVLGHRVCCGNYENISGASCLMNSYETSFDYFYETDEQRIPRYCFLRYLKMMYDVYGRDDDDEVCYRWTHIFGWN